MRIAVVFAPAGEGEQLSKLAQSVAAALRSKGHLVDLTEARAGEAHRLTGYEYVIVASEPVGLRGRIPRRLADFLAQSSSLQGKRSMAFVRKRGLASASALRRLMSAMESEGMIVNFAVAVANAVDAAEAARDAPIERNR